MGSVFSYQPKTQSNHDSYFIPEEIMNLKGEPLYVLVAHWGLHRQAPFSRGDVAQAFGLTERRAADLMRYLHKKKPSVESTLEKSIFPGTGKHGNSKLCMQILSVSDELICHHDKKDKVTFIDVPEKGKKAQSNKSKKNEAFCGMSLWNQLVLQK